MGSGGKKCVGGCSLYAQPYILHFSVFLKNTIDRKDTKSSLNFTYFKRMLADSSFIYFLLHFYAMMFGEDLFMYILQNLFKILKFQIFI